MYVRLDFCPSEPFFFESYTRTFDLGLVFHCWNLHITMEVGLLEVDEIQ